MLTLVGGQLTLEGVHLVLKLPRQAAEQWSLFESRDAEAIRVADGPLTIENAPDDLAMDAELSPRQAALHRDVAFFRVGPRATGESMMMPVEGRALPLLAVKLDNVIARGQATVLRAESAQPIRLSWSNGLLVTSERLLELTGSSRPPRAGAHVKLTLSHLTAVVQGGLCRTLNSTDAPHLLATELECDDSIFVGTADSPLIEQRGIDAIDDYLEQRLLYSGRRNFYEGFVVFWRIDAADPDRDLVELDFHDWKEHWKATEQLASPTGNVQWHGLPSALRPVHTHVAEDYRLAAGDGNPAHGSAPRGQDAGMIADLVPPLPALPTAPPDDFSSPSPREADAALPQPTHPPAHQPATQPGRTASTLGGGSAD
jgi:hypothetical protein